MCASVSLAHVWVDLDWMEDGEHISPGQSLPEDDTASRPKQVYHIPELFFLLPLLCFLVHWRRVCSITVELVLTTCARILLLRAFSCSGTYFAIFARSWKHGRINSPTSGIPQLWLLKSIDEYPPCSSAVSAMCDLHCFLASQWGHTQALTLLAALLTYPFLAALPSLCHFCIPLVLLRVSLVLLAHGLLLRETPKVWLQLLETRDGRTEEMWYVGCACVCVRWEV